MRILVVTYGPLGPESGASQLAVHLARALAARGHDALPWSPGSAPPGAPWWRVWQRRRLEEYLAGSGTFDAIDLPPLAITPRVARAAPLVARSIQPDLLYFAEDAKAELRRLASSPVRSAAHLLHGARLNGITVAGWQRAAVVLCLGTAEREWMRRRLPWTRPRLACYFAAPGPEDQQAFGRLRAERNGRRLPGSGTRFLWLGRWVPHKGTRRLARFLAERAAARPGDSFTLAGCGPEAAAELPKPLLEGGRVRLVPAFTRPELHELLREHDAGLFTSEAEGWGLSLNEMLESGLTVYATEAGGVRDLRPFFPGSLRPFPPPLETEMDPLVEGTGDFDAEAYYGTFRWDRIAESYERDVLARLGNPRGGRG